jgi:uracil-DNA glycosylase
MARSAQSGENRPVKAVIQRLESLERAGVTHVPRRARLGGQTAAAEPLGSTTSVPSETSCSQILTEKRQLSSPDGARQTAAGVIDDLQILQQQVCACERCELAVTRTQTVFGVGNPRARFCFLGEAPGADEDAQGEPFVGRAGQLLTKIIEACKLRREDVYILNVLKCRPPGNRNPAPEEVASCRGFFERQLELIQPEFIICLGTIAAQSLLKTDQPIGKLRGKFFDFNGSTVICTYHPAYLLRNPAAKRDVWEDMKLVMHKAGIEL